MQGILIPVIVGVLGGLAVGLQNPLAGLMGDRLGLLESAFIVHLGGAVVAGLPLLWLAGGELSGWRQLPWYAFLAGACGVALITSISFTIPRIGVAATVALILVGQLGVAAWVDHYGYLGAAVRSMDLSRAGGFGLLFVGAWLVLR